MHDLDAALDRVTEIEQRCGSVLEDGLRRAIAHPSACSPIRAGLTGKVAIDGIVGLVTMMTVCATRLATSDPVAALWLLLDTLRFVQDSERGPTQILSLTLGATNVRAIVATMHRILDGAKLDETARRQLRAAFEQLLAAEPRLGDVLRGDLSFVALHDGIAPLRTGWAIRWPAAVDRIGDRRQHGEDDAGRECGARGRDGGRVSTGGVVTRLRLRV